MGEFLLNYWYVAALSDEVTATVPLGRIFCNLPVVMYRDQAGVPHALEDRCCHKNYPLHRGEIEGDGLRCGYHGFLYDGAGTCIEIPGQATIPRMARVTAYPLVERHGWIWIWLGDPALADPADITDYHWLQDPGWGARSTRLHIKANYRLMIQNLLDLTHLAFVHRSTIGNRAVVDNADVRFDRGENEVKVTRWMLDIPPPPAYVKAGRFTGNIDRWMIVHYAPPGFCRLYTGGCPAGTGAPEGRRVSEMGWRNLNAVTPETGRTTHYFWGQAHNHDVGDQAVTDLVFENVRIAFDEDHRVFEDQQRTIDLVGERARREVSVMADAGALHAMRILDRLLAEQREGKPAMVTPGDLAWGPY